MVISIIPSAAFINSELISEFGMLPPSFLPIGNLRLYKLQIEIVLKSSSKIFLSLPKDFEIPEMDKNYLNDLGIEVIFVPKRVSLGSLGESIVYVLNMIGPINEPLRIIHGDSLIEELDLDDLDCFTTVAKTNQYYYWGLYDQGKQSNCFSEGFISSSKKKELILSGYFCFSQPYVLIQSIIMANGNFIHGLNVYNEKYKLHPIHQNKLLDCGHVQTYYKTKNYLSTQRSFNEIVIFEDKKTIIKTSNLNQNKILSEIMWYQNIPEEMKLYTPTFIKHKAFNEYEIEYLYLPNLSSIFVFGKNSVYIWQRIFQAISNFLNICNKYKKTEQEILDIDSLYVTKTLERLEEFSKITGVRLDKGFFLNNQPIPSLLKIIDIVGREITSVEDKELCIMHGDLCFSNIFYDFRAEIIKVIDPRGSINSDQISIYGDQRYDVAKLYHSVIGMYDFIIAGYFEFSKISDNSIVFNLPINEDIQAIQEEFLNIQFSSCQSRSREILAICILLFLSMLPLHSDNPRRQETFLANAMRLFLKMEEE